MALFAVRVANGVRLSTSSRGLRAHVGPRGARIHVGGGRTGVSTGAGPFTAYTGLSSTSRSRSSSGPTRAQLAQGEKERMFLELRSQIQAIVDMHRLEFPSVERQRIPPPDPVDDRPLITAREKQFLAGIRIWKRAERKTAKERAKEAAAADACRLAEDRTKEYKKRQTELDRWWDLLSRNDPETVIETVDEAFEDNSAPAAPCER